MRFDWYQATIKADPRVVMDTLAKLGNELRPADGLARKYHYDQGFDVHHNQRGVVAHVLVGGNGGNPHAFASSEHTDEFVSLVRQEWPECHFVSRADAAEDFNEGGAYDKMRSKALKVAREHRLSFPKYEDDLNAYAGRTQYVGSPSSDYRVRIYEKGFEQVAKMQKLFKRARSNVEAEAFSTVRNIHTGEDVKPENWHRAEMQNRPKGEVARYALSQATAEEAWCFSPWGQELLNELLSLELERFYIRTRKVSKDDEALRWMCQQYGAMLGRLAVDLGDWQCVGLQIEQIIKEQNDGRLTGGY